MINDKNEEEQKHHSDEGEGLCHLSIDDHFCKGAIDALEGQYHIRRSLT